MSKKSTNERLAVIETDIGYIKEDIRKLSENHAHQIEGIEKTLVDVSVQLGKLKPNWKPKDYAAVIMAVAALAATLASYWPR